MKSHVQYARTQNKKFTIGGKARILNYQKEENVAMILKFQVTFIKTFFLKNIFYY